MKRKVIISFLAVFLVIFGMSFDSFAYTYDPQGENYTTIYGSGVLDFITLDEPHIRLYSENHFDNVSLGSYFGTVDELALFEDTYGFNLLSSFPFLTYGYDYGSGNELDLSGMANTVIYTPYTNSNHNMFGCIRFTGSNVCLLSDSNHFYICSSEPFDFAFGEFYYSTQDSTWITNYIWQGWGTAPRGGSVDTANSSFSNDTVYAYDLTTIMSYSQIPYLQFANCPVYSTSQVDGNISVSDFAFANTSNYFDMNINTRNGVLTPDTPEPEPEYTSLGQYYNYVGMQGFFSPNDTYSLYNNMTFSYNDYMRLHPNEFALSLRYDCEVIPVDNADYTNAHLPFTYTCEKTIPLQDIFGSNNQNDGSQYKDLIYFVDLDADQTLSGVENFNEFMVAWYSYRTGLNAEWFDDGFFGVEGKYYKLKSNMNVQSIKITCRAKMIYTYDSNESASGYLIYHYDLLNGKNVVDGNAAATNNNPMPDPPSEYRDGQINNNSGGGSSYGNNNAFGGNGGNGGNVTINGLGNQPVYQLNETQLQGIAEMLNTITGTLQDSQENNGFWSVLKGCFDYIPERIWNWIIVTIGAVCAGAVARWYLTSKR